MKSKKQLTNPYLYCFFGLLMLFIGCKDKREQEEELSDVKASLETVGLKTFPLPEYSGPIFHSASLDQIVNVQFLSILVPLDGTILVYDYDSPNLLKALKTEHEGNHGVGMMHPLSSHLILSDSSFVFHNPQNATLFQLNFEGEILQKFILSDLKTFSTFPTPMSGTLAPMLLNGDEVIIPCSVFSFYEEYSSMPTSLSINLSTKEKKYLTTYPGIYDKAFWGDYMKYTTGICLNKDGGKMVVSHPIDDEVQVYDFNGELIGSKPVKSSYFPTHTPYHKNVNFWKRLNLRERDEKRRFYAGTNSDYRGILYDPFRKLYYRIAYLKPSGDRYMQGDLKMDVLVIVVNENFQKIGEFKFDGDKYFPTMLFVSKEGLNIGRKDLYSENEDELTLEVFEIKVVE